MPESPLRDLSRRERQIMDVVYARGRADAGEIQESISDAPSHSAVRALLRILVEKGHLVTEKEGTKLVYSPVHERDEVRRSVLKQLVDTYFDGSEMEVVSALLDLSGQKLSAEELGRLSESIERARKEGR